MKLFPSHAVVRLFFSSPVIVAVTRSESDWPFHTSSPRWSASWRSIRRWPGWLNPDGVYKYACSSCTTQSALLLIDTYTHIRVLPMPRLVHAEIPNHVWRILNNEIWFTKGLFVLSVLSYARMPVGNLDSYWMAWKMFYFGTIFKHKVTNYSKLFIRISCYSAHDEFISISRFLGTKGIWSVFFPL